MLITQENLDQLRVTFEKRFQDGYVAGEPNFSSLFFTVPSSTKTNVYGWLAQQLKIREWIGMRVAQNFSEHKYSLENKSYEGTVEVDKDDIEDDNLGLYPESLKQLGEAVKKHPDRLVKEVLDANPIAFDGKALFAGDHPCFDDAGSVYDNDHALTLDPTDIEQTKVDLNTIMAAGASIVGEDGEPLEVRYTHLYVAPQKELIAKEVCNNTITLVSNGNGAAAVGNQFAGVLEVVVCPKLAGAPGTFYLADNSKAIKALLWQDRAKPQFTALDKVDSPNVFLNKKFIYGVDYRGAMGTSLPFLIARSVGS